MTDQLCDEVRVRGEVFDLVDTDGEWAAFDPEAHGLCTRWIGTHCWEGYRCGYRVDDRLLLDAVLVAWSRTYARGDGPLLFGRAARRVRDHDVVWACYDELAHPVELTGGLLVGRGRSSFGLTPAAFAYLGVVELRFDHGRLLSCTDVTEEMRRSREDYDRRPRLPRFDGDWDDKERAVAWIAEARRQEASFARFFDARRRVAARR